MQRDMSYELDGVFAGRNAGELVSVRPARTRIARAPGLAPVGRLPGGDVRNITPELAHNLRIPVGHSIGAHRTRSLGIGLGKSLSNPMYRPGRDLAGDEDADMPFEGISIPGIGEVSTQGLLIAAAAGLAAYLLLKK